VSKLSVRRSERGASMIEFALIAPVFFLLLFTIIEGSAAFYARNTIGLAIADSARAGSIGGSDADVITKTVASTDKAFGSDVELIIIYKASDVDSEPEASCIAGVSGPSCAVYGPSSFVSPTCSGWCKADRNADDLLGVWVRTKFNGITGANPFNFTWIDKSITIVEPGV